jgi:predicted SAM-dependent methyltransferase
LAVFTDSVDWEGYRGEFASIHGAGMLKLPARGDLAMRTRLKQLFQTTRLQSPEREATHILSKFARPYRLNIGCGSVKFDGWINIDVEPTGVEDLKWDVSKSLPFPDASCLLIYNEHFLEHLDILDARRFLSECHRALASGGILRVAMPSLEETIDHYAKGTWKDQPWLKKYGYTWIATRAEYINVCFRYWGHRWLYDAEEFQRRLIEAGFVNFKAAAWGVSAVDELSNRETRQESVLIFEAMK